MEKLQYTALRTCTSTVVGSRKESLQKITVVESVEMFVRAMRGRFLARTMCNPVRVGMATSGDPALVGKWSLSLGGPY